MIHANHAKPFGALVVLAILAFGVLGAMPAAAQLQTGDLVGTTRDEQGGALPGVTVTLSGIGAPRVQSTNENGGFRFIGLFPGAYQLAAELEGFSSLEYPDVTVRVGGTTNLELTLNSAITDVITVTSASPILDERQVNRGATVTATELDSVPTARDPWSLLALAPGVQIDRVNVGGNESGQQSNFLGPGASGSENTFAVDGVILNDMAAVGGSATYFDFGAYEEVQFTTSSADVTIATAGVTINQVTKRGTNEWRVEARYLRTDGELQSEPTVQFGNKIDSVEEYGGNFGGPLLKDRLWFWASYGESDIRNLAPSPDGTGRLSDRTVLEDLNAKLNFQLAASNSGVLHYWTNDKQKFGRVFTFLGDPLVEATHDQTTPQDIYKIEDTQLIGSNFSITGLWSQDDGIFTLAPKGGRDALMFTDSDGILHGTSFDFFQDAIIEQTRVDASYFATTGAANHELRFGAGFREQENHSTTVWPNGRNTSYYDGSIAIARFSRNRVLGVKSEYTSAWLQDTITLDRWTFAAGARYDLQKGENLPSISPANPQAQGLIPELRFDGNDAGGFEWESIVPRLSATFAIGEERKTLARATFSQYASQLGQGRISFVNPAGGYSYAYFYFVDDNNNVLLEPGEIPSMYFAYTYNINPDDPGSLISVNSNDPNLDPEISDEVTLGIEHAFRPDLGFGLTGIWRNTHDVIESRGLVTDESGQVRQWTRNDFVATEDGATGELPDGTTRTVPVFGLRDGITPTFGSFVTNGDSEHEYFGITANLNKRLSNRWSARGHATWNDWNWNIGPDSLLHDDPTNTTGDGIDAGGSGDIYTEASGGAKADTFVGSQWSFGLYGLYQVAPDQPWGFNLAASLSGREGYSSPPTVRAPRGDLGRVVTEMTTNIDEFRNDDIILLDARIEKEFKVNDFSLLVGIDGFNLTNENYVLQRNRRLDLDGGNEVRERLSPRVFRVGLTMRWQ